LPKGRGLPYKAEARPAGRGGMVVEARQGPV